MTSRFRWFLPFLLLAALLLGACASAQPVQNTLGATPGGAYPAAPQATQGQPAASEAYPASSGPIELTDGLNRAVKLNAPAQKIVSLAPSNTEILFAIGGGSQVVGRDEFSDYPAEAKSIQSVGGSMGKYNLEAIAALKPDLVLASELNTADQVKALEGLGLKVYYLSNPKDFDGLYANLQTVGQLTGREKEAAGLVDTLKARVQAVVTKVAPQSYAPKVFYELDASDPAKPYTTGPGTFMDKLIGLAGAYNIGDTLSGAYAQISQEEVLAQNPDVILLGDAAYGTTPEQVAARPGWSAIQAVKDQKVYAFDDNLASRPGPRLVDGLEALARLLHPGLFQ